MSIIGGYRQVGVLMSPFIPSTAPALQKAALSLNLSEEHYRTPSSHSSMSPRMPVTDRSTPFLGYPSIAAHLRPRFEVPMRPMVFSRISL
jgi:hypothetical protein